MAISVRMPAPRVYMLLAVALVAVAALFFINTGAMGVAHAECAEGEVCPDRSGLTTGTGSDLKDLAPGTLTEDDFKTAASREPFAVKLADW